MEEVQSKDGGCFGIVAATVPIVRFSKIWDNKFRFFRSLVLMLCGCKMKTLLMESEWRIKAFETEWFGKLICVSYREQKVNDFIHNIVTSLMDSQKPLLKTFKWQKLVWFSHVV